MKNENFADMVTKHFGYLEAKYKYRVASASYSNVRPQTDGAVKYVSDTTVVIIDSDTGQVGVRFVRLNDDERYYLDPVIIHEYISTSEKEKQVLLSREMADLEAANAISNKMYLLSASNWREISKDVYGDIEAQLEIYANWLQKHANMCLLGDFSRWPEFYEYKINRLLASELRRGSKETVKALVKGENGLFQTIERPIFKNERDHLNRLRKDVLGSNRSNFG